MAGDRTVCAGYQTGMTRRFLFLQGPHGPFFGALAKRLTQAGADVGRIGFTLGDKIFWGRLPRFEKFVGSLEQWRAALEDRIERDGTTDIVCYGGTRPIHVVAKEVAEGRDITLHVFEEGYLRPYWVTYERRGTNAASRLMDIDTDRMDRALTSRRVALRSVPDRWGAIRQHIFWGAVYHGLLLIGSHRYRGFQPHRNPAPAGEFTLYLKHLLTLPARRLQRRLATLRVHRGGFPYHVVLLQLAHDANFRDFGPFATQSDFLKEIFSGFANGAPSHHHLVLKAHPLEDGRQPLRPIIAHLTDMCRLQGRVHLITGGKTARLLDFATSAVTVNSTAAEQALWRGLPLKAMGRAVYHRPEFTSEQPLTDFFASPEPPDHEAYLTYRRYLLQTSQIAGGFYSGGGRRAALQRLPDLMLASDDPYDLFEKSAATTRQHIQIVA